MRVMNIQKTTITICAVCNRELKPEQHSGVEDAPVSLVADEAVAYSHGICYECGVRLYGARIMAEVSTRLSAGGRS